MGGPYRDYSLDGDAIAYAIDSCADSKPRGRTRLTRCDVDYAWASIAAPTPHTFDVEGSRVT